MTKKKKVMYNEKTGELRATQMQESNPKFKTIFKDFKHIGYANGFNLTIVGIKK